MTNKHKNRLKELEEIYSKLQDIREHIEAVTNGTEEAGDLELALSLVRANKSLNQGIAEIFGIGLQIANEVDRQG